MLSIRSLKSFIPSGRKVASVSVVTSGSVNNTTTSNCGRSYIRVVLLAVAEMENGEDLL